MPEVSVVIATNRRSPYIAEALDSVVSQTFTDWEILVVRDGASGWDPDLPLPADKYRRLLLPASGVSAARNAGVAAARGKFVAFLDDDDRWLPGKLSAQYEVLRGAPEIGLCHTQFRFIDGGGTLVGPGWAEPVTYDGMLAGAWGVCTSASIFRKHVLLEVGGSDTRLRIAGDLDLLFKVGRHSSIHFIPETLTEYRVHSGGISRARFRHYREARSVFLAHREIALAEENLPRVERIAAGLADLRRHFQRGAWKSAAETLSRGQVARTAYHASLAAWLCVPFLHRRQRRRPAPIDPLHAHQRSDS